MGLRKYVQSIPNLLSWKTKEKLLVIQSDDWGSLRMDSNQVREKLAMHPMIDAQDPYNLFDTLASKQDLEHLFETLNGIQDNRGRNPVITANCVTSNPDFEKISASGFKTYYSENVHQTFDRFNQSDAFEMWKEGIKKNLFHPQFHGHEHVNVPFWMQKLQANHAGVKAAFEAGNFGVSFKELGLRKRNFQAAWDYENSEDQTHIENGIIEGLNDFEKYFGYRSKTAVAPSYVWSDKQEKLLHQHGVNYMQTIPYQQRPAPGSASFDKKFRVGKRAGSQMGYQLRNVFFEPSLDGDNHEQVKMRIRRAFAQRVPAVVCSHRLNFIGGLNENNRRKNIESLKTILNWVVQEFPDVQFINSEELAAKMDGSNT